jgi:DNA helicase II / ATP-dependent DNA helicase PcrA
MFGGSLFFRGLKMRYLADLHIHSPYSRATSPESTLAGLAAWGQIKGISLLGTGDFTHPAWFKKLFEELVPAEPGFYKLKNQSLLTSPLPDMQQIDVRSARFMLSAEVSCIYKRHGKVRKVHNLLYVPDLESAARVNSRLGAIGNIRSDGRPILGLDSRDLLEILLEESPDGFLVPAHIWTPWFSIFGSKSGFDCMEDCFGDLTDQIFALETGLSSDPAMNRTISALDRFALISNSDCHSPSKIGREANIFRTGFDFFSLKEALRKNSSDSFEATVEFFPEEGKYHQDGHRSCGFCCSPEETAKLKNLCPVCGQPLTVGVENRVHALADRSKPLYKPDAPAVYSMIPLQEILGELFDKGPATKTVMAEYSRLISRFGSEFGLLLDADIDEINSYCTKLGEAILNMRTGMVSRKPGFDGQFGVISISGKYS